MVDYVTKFQSIVVNLGSSGRFFYYRRLRNLLTDLLTSEGIRSFKVVCEYICSVLDRKVRGLKYLIGSQSFPSY